MYVIEVVYRDYNDIIQSDFLTRDNKILFFRSKEKAQNYVKILDMMSDYIEELEESEYCERDCCFPLKFTRLCDPFPIASSFQIKTLDFEVV